MLQYVLGHAPEARMYFSTYIMNPKKRLTEHQARKEELDKIKREILALDLRKGLVEEITPRPLASQLANIALRADMQEMAIHAAVELRKLMEDYVQNGHAFSYRNFLVSAAGVGVICENSRCKWFVTLAYNTKPHKNQEKKCAEMRIEEAMKRKRAKILFLTVVGFPQPGDNTPALHPCPECRVLMQRKYQGLYFPYSRIVCVHPTTPDREGFTIGGLMRYHKEPDVWTP